MFVITIQEIGPAGHYGLSVNIETSDPTNGAMWLITHGFTHKRTLNSPDTTDYWERDGPSACTLKSGLSGVSSLCVIKVDHTLRARVVPVLKQEDVILETIDE